MVAKSRSARCSVSWSVQDEDGVTKSTAQRDTKKREVMDMSPHLLRVRRLWVLALLALCLTWAPARAFATQGMPDGQEVADQAPAIVLAEDGHETGGDAATLKVRVDSIQPLGNVILAISPADLLERFALGDVVSVSTGTQPIDMPVVENFSDVDAGTAALLVRSGICRLFINMGSFAEVYGITADTTFQITLEQQGGYADELALHDLSYTDERSDYPDLSDAQFANFRAVTTTGMGKGVLYRSATPVNPQHNRNTYADAALRDAKVTVALNLVDDEGDLATFEGYADSYYATIDHIARAMSVDFTSPANQEVLAEELRFLAAHPGTYVIHCLEGKDRTGFVVALLECFMGASRDEVIADYMESYANYYGVSAGDERYERIARRSISKMLERAFDVEDLAACNLADEATGYLSCIGLTAEELSAIRKNLSGTSENGAEGEHQDEATKKEEPTAPDSSPTGTPDPSPTGTPASNGKTTSSSSLVRSRSTLPATGDRPFTAAHLFVAAATVFAAVFLAAKGTPR